MKNMLVMILCGAALASGQTQLDLQRQARNVDFSQASFTRPSRTSTVLPATCSIGETLFLTTAVNGGNLYGCTATNTWAVLGKPLTATGVSAGTYGSATAVPVLTVNANGVITAASQVTVTGGGGGGGASMATQLGDFRVERISNSQLRVGAGCTTTTPCNFRIGGAVTAITAPLDVNITSATNTGKVLLYVSSAGSIMAATSAGLNVNCTGGCGAITNVSFFPADSIPLYEWSASTTIGQWNTQGTDRRAVYVSKVLTAGPGLTRVDNTSTGVTALSLDPTLVGIRVGIPASASAVCTAGQWAADNNFYYVCVSANTWRRSALGSW